MNTNGCPPGFFTDEIQVYYSTPFSCDSSVQAWLGFAISICVFRIIILGMVWGAWFQQRERLTNRAVSGDPNARRRSTRLPLVPLLSTTATMLLCLFVALASNNLINAQSGTGIVMIATWLMPVCAIQFTTLRKMVALGFRIFRFNLSNMKNGSNLGNIASFDKVLNALSAVMALLVLSCLSFVIAGTTDAGRGVIFPRLAIVALLLEQTALYIAMMYQFHRCIQCVMNSAVDIGGKHKPDRAFIAAVRRMRYQQLVIFITAVVGNTLFAYYAVTLQFYWFVTCITFLLECFTYFSMSLSFLRCGRRQPSRVGETGLRSGGRESDSASQRHSMTKNRGDKQMVSVLGETLVNSAVVSTSEL